MSTNRMALVALATALVWGNLSLAAPLGPGPDPVECADIKGTLTATPSSIDRETSTSLATSLTWSVDAKRCPVSPIVTLERRTVPLERHTVPLSGQMNCDVAAPCAAVFKTTIFVLRAENRDLARATVTVNGDPGFIGFSPGRQVTPYEITKFNQQWMQPFALAQRLVFTKSTLQALDSSGDTATGEWMAAMVRMFDLTQDPRYLDHLRDFVQLTLQFRDDRPLDSGPNVFRPTDQIRNKVGLPAWGGGLADQYGLHSVNELTSSLYAYPIAAFARILAENPAWRNRSVCNPSDGKNCKDAIDLANMVLQTVSVFLPQIHRYRAGNFVEATLTNPREYRNRPTQADCANAYQHAVKHEPDRKARWNQECSDCNNLRVQAGKPVPHNVNLTFSMVLIELSRVLDDPFYLQSRKRLASAEDMRDRFLVLIPRQERYFADHLNPGDLRDQYDACQKNFCWYYMDSSIPDITSVCEKTKTSSHGPHPEDTDHGSMDMSHVGLFSRDSARLNAAAKRLNEPFAFPDLQRFARTFVETIAARHDFKHDVAGREEKSPADSNTRCEGWLELTRADARVWQLCRDMSLRIIDEQQPYLGIGNHSALLWTKQFLPSP